MLQAVVETAKAAGIATIYVSGMYATSADNSKRNQSSVIFKRLLSSAAMTILLGILPLAHHHFHQRSSSSSASSSLNFLTSLGTDSAQRSQFLTKYFTRNGNIAFKLVLTLFAGVLLEWGIYHTARLLKRIRPSKKEQEEEDQGEKRQQHDFFQAQQKVSQSHQYQNVSSGDSVPMMRFRDLFVAPLTEEIVFRGGIQIACLGSAVLLNLPNNNFSSSVKVFTSATIFALAHAHHAIYLDYSAQPAEESTGRSSIIAGCIRNLTRLRVDAHKLKAHMLPPMLFGLLSGVLCQLDVGIFPLIAAHSFCNLVGPPKWQLVVIHDDLVREQLPFLFVSQQQTEQANSESRFFSPWFFPVVHVACIVVFVRGCFVA